MPLDAMVIGPACAAIGAAIGVIGKGHYDTRRAINAGEVKESVLLINSLMEMSKRQDQANVRTMEKVLTEQAHLTLRVDELSRSERECLINCERLAARVAMMEREAQTAQTVAGVGEVLNGTGGTRS